MASVLSTMNDMITVNVSVIQRESFHDVNRTTTLNEAGRTITSARNDNLSEAFQSCRVILTQFSFIPWDNPDNVISLESALRVVKVLEGVFIPLLALLGMPANILSCWVFYRQHLRYRINMLLFSQALVDFVVEVYMFLHSAEYLYTLLLGQFDPYGPVMTFKTNNGLNVLYGFVYVSGFITTTIAFERCLCITTPFTAKKILRTTHAAIIVGVVAAVLIGMHYMVAEKFKIGCAYYPKMGFVLEGFYPSEFYTKNSTLIDVLSSAVYGIILPCFFAFTTTISTVVISVKLKTAAAWRKQSTSLKPEWTNKELVLTRMLVSVSCLFIACTLPNIVVRIVPLLVPDFQLGGRYQNLYLSGVCLSHFTPALNSSLNFLFYFHMGAKFRKTLSNLCCLSKSALALSAKSISISR